MPIIGGLIILVAVILVATFFEKNIVSSESAITREFSKTKINSGDQITVTLKVSISDKDTFYAIEEDIPEEWSIINNKGGASGNFDVLK